MVISTVGGTPSGGFSGENWDFMGFIADL